jgi:hypothetical protein
LRTAKPENRIFFLGKNLILRTVLVSPLFYSEIKNQLNSHIEAKKKNPPKPTVLKKGENRPILVWMYTMEVLVHLLASQIAKKKTYPLCIYPMGLG